MSSEPSVDFEPTYIDDLPEAERSYPVIVTVHNEHIVWIEGDSPKDALQRLQHDGAWHEHLGSNNGYETQFNAYEEMRSPDKWDKDIPYEAGWAGGYQGLECRAHVDSHEHAQFLAKRGEERRQC